MDQNRINKKKAELCGGLYCVRDDNGVPTGQGIDEYSELQNYVLAILSVVLVKGATPSWWNLEELSDQELVHKVFLEVQKFENSFRRRGGDSAGNGQHSGSSQEGGTQTHQAANAGKPVEKMVDKEILSALDA